MSTNPLTIPIFRSPIKGNPRLAQPSLSAQRSFKDWLRPPINEVASDQQQAFEQEDETQRQKRQQIILQMLSHPGAIYRDPWRLIRRDPGMSLTWQLVNGPMAGLTIKAVLAAGELQLRLSVSDWHHYHCLLANKPHWLTLLNQGEHRVSIEVLHVVSST